MNQQDKRKICDTCENKTKRLGIDVCNICGCVLLTLTLTNKCPKGKWNEDRTQN